jgi:ethanolamine utilization protein EutJ
MYLMTAAGLRLENLVNQPQSWDFSGAEQLYAGVDLGTYKAIAIIIDETGKPRAVRMQRAEVVRSGLIIDYAGAQQIVRDMLAELRTASPLPIERGATSFPPKTEYANIDATRYILEGAGLEVLNVLDEPSAANQILKLTSGAIVDVGGGTTGIAVIKDGNIVFSDDEATGGVHLSLVVAGNYKIDYEAAEKLKTDPHRNAEIIAVVKPVIEKIASIVNDSLRPFTDLSDVCLVGGTCELKGFAKIVQDVLQINTFRPEKPQFVTPLGIALSCLEAG